MNRRDFLKVVTATAVAVYVPSFIPDDAKITSGVVNKRNTVIGDITRDITYHPDRLAYFVAYSGRINNNEYYYGDFVEKTDKKTLHRCDVNAMRAFKGISKPQTMKLTEAKFMELSKMRDNLTTEQT